MLNDMRISVTARSLLCLLVTLVQGYSFGYGNHTTLLPMIRYHQGHNMLHNDLIQDIFPGYTTYFYKAFAFLPVSLEGVEVIFFIVYIVSIYLFYHAMIKLFDLVGGNTVASFLGGLAVALGVVPLLGLSPWQFKLDHGAPGLALAAWALYNYVGKREMLAFSLIGIGFNIHALYSAHLFILFTIHMLSQIRGNKLTYIIKPIVVFLLLASPVIVWKFAGMTGGEALNDEWLHIIHVRLSSQVFFSDTPTSMIVHFTLFLCTLIVTCRKRIINYDRTSPYGRILFLLAGITLFCLVQILFVDYYPLRIVLEGQFWRASQWLAMIGVFLIIHGILNMLNNGDKHWLRSIAIAGTVSLILTNTLMGLWVALAGYMVLEKYKTRIAYLLLTLSYIVVFLVMTMGDGYLSTNLLWQLRFPGGGVFPTYMLALAGPAFMVLFKFKRRGYLVAGLFVIVFVYASIKGPVYASINRVNNDPWKQVQTWARNHTPPDSVFITPPNGSGFRIMSDRAVVGELKDGGMVNNSRKYALEWWHRMKLLGVEDICKDSKKRMEYPQCLVSRYQEIDTPAFKELFRIYGANYVVTSVDHDLSLSAVWENRKYRVYKVK